MQNPWKELPTTPPYLLPSEKEPVESFNASAASRFIIRHELLPEPFLGNPEAPIILLNLNPGFSEYDIEFYKDKKVRELWQRNLLHNEIAYPFYLLNPAISQDAGGPKWWSKRLKEPIQLAGRKRVAQRVCCIEYFPYHSRKFKSLGRPLPSQKYGFYLVEQAIARQAIVILMRSAKLWYAVVPKLKNYGRLFSLNSWQNPVISRRNCPEGFAFIEEALM